MLLGLLFAAAERGARFLLYKSTNAFRIFIKPVFFLNIFNVYSDVLLYFVGHKRKNDCSGWGRGAA